MADGVAIAKVLAMLGFIVIFMAALSGETPQAWTAARSTIEAGVTFPEFWNPFDEETVRITAYASSPLELFLSANTTGDETIFGCSNTTGGRADCLSSQDADGSYIEAPCIAFDDPPGFEQFCGGSSGGNMGWNYSNPSIRGMSGALVRNIHIEFQCRTLLGDSGPYSFFFTFSTFDNNLGESGELAIDVYCPKGRNYQTVTQDLDYPDGLRDSMTNPYQLFETTQFGEQSWMAPHSFIDGDNVGEPTLRLTYFKLELTVATNRDCGAQEGAWFPAFDDVACAVVGFANFVWKGFQFIYSGFAFIALSLAAVIAFIGTVVIQLLVGTVSIYGSLFALGAPSPVQEIIDVLAIALAGYLILQVVFILRGS